MSTKPDNGDGREHCETVTQSFAETVPDLLAKFALTDAEAGRLIGVNGSAVRNLHRCGSLRGVKVAGKLCWRPADDSPVPCSS